MLLMACPWKCNYAPSGKQPKQGNGSWKAGKLVGMQAEAKVKGQKVHLGLTPNDR